MSDPFDPKSIIKGYINRRYFEPIITDFLLRGGDRRIQIHALQEIAKVDINEATGAVKRLLEKPGTNIFQMDFELREQCRAILAQCIESIRTSPSSKITALNIIYEKMDKDNAISYAQKIIEGKGADEKLKQAASSILGKETPALKIPEEEPIDLEADYCILNGTKQTVRERLVEENVQFTKNLEGKLNSFANSVKNKISPPREDVNFLFSILFEIDVMESTTARILDLLKEYAKYAPKDDLKHMISALMELTGKEKQVAYGMEAIAQESAKAKLTEKMVDALGEMLSAYKKVRGEDLLAKAILKDADKFVVNMETKKAEPSAKPVDKQTEFESCVVSIASVLVEAWKNEELPMKKVDVLLAVVMKYGSEAEFEKLNTDILSTLPKIAEHMGDIRVEELNKKFANLLTEAKMTPIVSAKAMETGSQLIECLVNRSIQEMDRRVKAPHKRDHSGGQAKKIHSS